MIPSENASFTYTGDATRRDAVHSRTIAEVVSFWQCKHCPLTFAAESWKHQWQIFQKKTDVSMFLGQILAARFC